VLHLSVGDDIGAIQRGLDLHWRLLILSL
jgi:hypothetical protein